MPVGKLFPTQHRINAEVVLALVADMLKAIADYFKNDRGNHLYRADLQLTQNFVGHGCYPKMPKSLLTDAKKSKINYTEKEVLLVDYRSRITILPQFYIWWVCFLYSINYTLIIKNKEALTWIIS